jgi:hypothetical protein
MVVWRCKMKLEDILDRPFGEVIEEITSSNPPECLWEFLVENEGITVKEVLTRLGLSPITTTVLQPKDHELYKRQELARALYGLGEGEENPFRPLFQ